MSNLEKHEFNERLIDEVEKESVIWDMKSRLYKSQQLKEVAWRRVATAMGSNVGEVKARWKNLRDSFRRVFKARHPVLQSGAGAEDSEVEDSVKSWIFYDRLLFLQDSIVGRPTSGNLEQLPDVESEDTEQGQSNEETAESLFRDIYSETSTSPEPDTCPRTTRRKASTSSGAATQIPTNSSHNSRPEGGRKRKKPYDDEIASLTSIVSKVPDDAEHFGQLIAAKLRRCPPRLREDMELDLLNTAAKYLHESEPDS
ncbi:transcription factor Adf-1 [Rhipicephalus sanguineus]|nr:transcription factor Adf-1 [Rhipicephalus sanguineus]